MKHKVNLEWYCLYYDSNKKRIRKYNILNEELADIIGESISKHKINNLKQLKEYISKWLKYYYWSKTEWEVMIYGIFSDEAEKIDVYTQAELNIDRIVEYVNDKLELGLK